MKSVSDLQGLWPDFRTFAEDIGVKAGTAQQWRVRDRIPGEYWHHIVAKAKARAIRGVTFEVLEALSKQKEPEVAK